MCKLNIRERGRTYIELDESVYINKWDFCRSIGYRVATVNLYTSVKENYNEVSISFKDGTTIPASIDEVEQVLLFAKQLEEE